MFATVAKWLCGHRSLRRETQGEEKGLACNKCDKFFAFPKELTTASGVFARIESRIELEERIGARIFPALPGTGLSPLVTFAESRPQVTTLKLLRGRRRNVNRQQ